MSCVGVIRSLVLTIAALAACTVAGCGGAQSRYLSHLERGKHYLAQGTLDKAGIEFRNALQIQPKSPDALYLSGQVAERRGDLRAAVSLYQGAIDAKPGQDQIDAAAALGRLFAIGGAPDRALKLVEPLLARHPDNAELLVVRSAARLRTQNLPGAQSDVERALQLDPRNARAVGLLAGMKRDAGDVDGAISLVSGVMARIPSSVELHELLAALEFSVKKSAEGEEQLRELIKLKPRELRYRYQLALALTRDHQLDAAQRVLEDAVKSAPDDDQSKVTLLGFLFNQRTAEDGKKALADFVARAPSDYELRLSAGELLQHRGDETGASSLYSEVIKLDGTRPHGLVARNRLAALELSRGHMDSAEKLIAEVLEESPHDDDALALRGSIEVQHNDLLAAIADLRAAVRDQPGAVSLRQMLAGAYLKNGEPGLAEEMLRGAMQVEPANVRVRIELASVLVGTDRADQAVTLLEETVRNTPNDPMAREALIRADLAKRDLAAANTAVKDLEALQPKAARTYFLAGVVAQADHRPQDSEKEWEHALSLGPDAVDVLSALTRLESAQGHGDRAIARAREAADRHQTDPVRQNLLGEVYLTNKDYPHATEAFSRASALAPQWGTPYRNLGIVKVAANDIPAAIQEYQAGLKAAPDDYEIGVELAAAYARQNRIDEAIAQLEALHARNPKQSIAANNLALLLVTYKTDKRSLDHALELTDSFANSDSGTLLDTNGWVRYKRGEYAQALPILQRALTREPDSKEILYHLAMAELHAGQADLARSNLQNALSGTGRFLGSDDARAVLASLGDPGLKSRQ